MDNKVMLLDSNDVKIGETFIRRAKQLVRQQRATWVDDTQSAIRFAPGMENMDSINDDAIKKATAHAVILTDDSAPPTPRKQSSSYRLKVVLVVAGLIALGVAVWFWTNATSNASAFMQIAPMADAGGTVWVEERQVTIHGNTYNDALIFRTNRRTHDDADYIAYSLHYLNGMFSIISGYLGQWGQHNSQHGLFRFYGDGKLIRSFTVTPWEMMPVTIPVEGVGQLTIKFSNPTGIGVTTYSLVGATIH